MCLQTFYSVQNKGTKEKKGTTLYVPYSLKTESRNYACLGPSHSSFCYIDTYL